MLNPIPKFTLWDVIDILVVAFILYRLFLFLSQTRAIQILVGLLLILILSVVSKFLHLYTLSFILNNLITIGIFALVVIFQPEIRRILARIGEQHFGIFSSEEEAERVIDEMVRACAEMSEKRIGALLVIEREINLDNYIEAGTLIDGKVSKELLITLFWPGTPLHDGATIIRKDKVYKAGAFLPLSLNPNLPQVFGTRHRAAVGITEETDAVSVIVSEESGAISVSYAGKLIKNIEPSKLRKVLKGLLIKKTEKKSPLLSLLRKRDGESA
ncbi:diadenylate cyclase CdaA [Thermovibrio sp.]